jgi:hypothetical protein
LPPSSELAFEKGFKVVKSTFSAFKELKLVGDIRLKYTKVKGYTNMYPKMMFLSMIEYIYDGGPL